MKDYYKEIATVLSEYENYKPYHTKDIDWACNRIDLCWKLKKITEAQMEELANRAVAILEGGI